MSDSAWPDGSKWSGGTSGMNNGQYGDPSDSPDVTRIQSFSLPVRPQSQPPQNGHEEQQDTVPGQQEQPGQVPLPGQEYSASAHRVPPAAQELGTSTYRIPPSVQDFAQQAQSAPPTSPQAAAPMSQDFSTTVQPVPQDLRRGSPAPADYQQQPPAAPAFQPSSQDFATTVQPAVPGLQRGPGDFQQAPSVQDYQQQHGYQQPSGYQQPQPGSEYQQPSGYQAYPGGGQPSYPAAQPDAYGSGASKPKSGTMATTALVCSVLWGAGVTALIGLIVGFMALNQIKQNGGEGKDRATMALWIGGIGVVLAIILFVA